MLVAFAICQIIILYVLIFVENWDYLLRIEIIMFGFLCMCC
jgi:hypothetical protein